MSTTQAPPAMTSRERVLAALRREPVDRTPLVNPTSMATVELMDLAEAPFPAANREPELMARLAATGRTVLGFDSIMPVFSIIQESSALGCKIQWEQKDNWPTVKMREPIWRDADEGPAAVARHAKARPHFVDDQNRAMLVGQVRSPLNAACQSPSGCGGKTEGPPIFRTSLPETASA